jgi:adenosylmethionine-8-amino-7-oxononanoate aminotransferase
MNNAELIERDLSVLWHPCTQMKDHEWLPMIPIKRGEGVWLEDFDGNRYLDAVSSWWVNLFGHANPRINAAIRSQIEQLEHVILAGCTHEPVVALAEKLVEITPPGLARAFFSDNGSSSIEVALKMSYHYWRNVGKGDKTKFIALRNSYHGETLGALAVGDVTLYKETYEPLLLKPITVPGPDHWFSEPGESEEACAVRRFQAMEQALERHASEVAAVIVEPLIQCAGGMRMYHPVYLKLLREACDRYGVHLIADEIAVGFGRTGTLFACEQAAVSPDLMCLSKGLTAGYLPVAVTMVTDEIYEAFYDDYETLRAFLHSHSYNGNPIGCKVALETIAIFEEERVIEKNQALAAHLSQALERFREHPHVGQVRQTGMVGAVEIVKEKASRDPYPWQERRGLRVYRHALSRGALLRPLGNVTYFMPPYVITPEEIDFLAEVAWEGIERAVAG